jgi:hypothetical protein
MSTDIEQIATEAVAQLEIRNRNEDHIVATKDDAPDWVKDLVHTAHGDHFLPDDFIYETISDALGALSDNENLEEMEWADQGVRVYADELLKWLGSNLYRQGYVDEATEQFGHSEDGIINDIARGQMMERMQIMASVKQSLETRLEEIE